jgi:hypothetical protein
MQLFKLNGQIDLPCRAQKKDDPKLFGSGGRLTLDSEVCGSIPS